MTSDRRRLARPIASVAVPARDLAAGDGEIRTIPDLLVVQQQRQVTAAIKNAREMALLPYPGQSAGAADQSRAH